MEQFLELKRKLTLTLSIAIGLSFLIALLISYSVAKVSIHNALVKKELPLIATTVASDLQDDSLGILLNANPTAYQRKYLNAVDYGLDREKLNSILNLYKKAYNHNIYFVDLEGHVIASTRDDGIRKSADIYQLEGLRQIAGQITSSQRGSYEYDYQGERYLLTVRHLPNLNWLLFVDTSEDEALANVRNAFYLNLFICLFVTLAIVGLTHIAINRYQWQLKQKLASMAISDTLTGLANRYSFDIIINHILANAQRNQIPVSLIFIDIDLFRTISHQYGHELGERIIKQMGSLIKNSIRASDVGCRWSDDKFLITLNKCHGEKAQIIAEALRMNIENSILSQELKGVKTTLSIGITQYNPNDNVVSLLERVERALIQAQAEGGNKAVYLKPPHYTPNTMGVKRLALNSAQMQA
ncbi:diguanylate cyclase (GGDEF)-like protein [Agitococcus lubricus]|uniref:diguanylate cyclase n=2 Tax=Agitococcus lubricus TaxID=1077255 RepID=A0A2T5J2A9_9GAMM|nr:diguanylate cyclase (GGDEF)-like protein [Agitococcus lubricus]